MIAKTYQDLIDEIGYYALRIQQLETERKKLMNATFGGPEGYKSDTSIEKSGVRGSRLYMSIDEGLLRIEQIDCMIAECRDMIQTLQSQLESLEDVLDKLEGRHYKIFYLKRCKNMSFSEVAKEVGLSQKQVQRIYQEVVGNE